MSDRESEGDGFDSAIAYGVTTTLPLSPCRRQWKPNVPALLIATGASCALSGGMLPDS
jgi:hypothetical protein